MFSGNRLGLNDSIEGGQSLTVGFDYEKTRQDDINKFLRLGSNI